MRRRCRAALTPSDKRPRCPALPHVIEQRLGPLRKLARGKRCHARPTAAGSCPNLFEALAGQHADGFVRGLQVQPTPDLQRFGSSSQRIEELGLALRRLQG